MDAYRVSLQEERKARELSEGDLTHRFFTLCQGLSTQLDSESSQRASEVARLGARLDSGLGVTHDAAGAKVAHLRTELADLAKVSTALREGAIPPQR